MIAGFPCRVISKMANCTSFTVGEGIFAIVEACRHAGGHAVVTFSHPWEGDDPLWWPCHYVAWIWYALLIAVIFVYSLMFWLHISSQMFNTPSTMGIHGHGTSVMGFVWPIWKMLPDLWDCIQNYKYPQKFWKLESCLIVSSVPADVLAPYGARTSAGTVMTKVGSCLWAVLAFKSSRPDVTIEA